MRQSYSQRVRVALSPQEYTETEIPEAWMNTLDAVAPGVGGAVKECRKKYSAWRCKNGHLIYRRSLCKKRDYCYTCSRVYTAGLVEDSIEFLANVYGHIGGLAKFGEGELTIPKEAWERISDDGMKLFRGIGIETIKEFFGGCILGEGCDCRAKGVKHKPRYDIGGSIVVHYWHSSNPFAGFYPHIHYTMMDLAFDRKENRFVRLNLFLKDKKSLQSMRELWRRNFEAEYGSTEAKVFNCFYHYQSGYGHLKQRLSYAFREPVADFYRYATSAITPVDFDANWLRRALGGRKHQKHVVWFGWLSDCVRYKYLSRLELVIPKKRERDKARRDHTCPICGENLVCFYTGMTLKEILEKGGGHIMILRFGG